jgi:hypothetical protein
LTRADELRDKWKLSNQTIARVPSLCFWRQQAKESAIAAHRAFPGGDKGASVPPALELDNL